MTISGTGSIANIIVGNIGSNFTGFGGVIPAATNTWIQLPYSATLTDWVVSSSVTGSVSIDVKKAGLTAFPNFTSIVNGSNYALLTNQIVATGSCLGWTVSLNKTDFVQFYVNSATTVSYVNLTLNLNKY